MIADPTRCPWPTNELALRYHDEEWGVPVHDDRTHFEFLTLESAQAGLSWDTVLRKREHYRAAFANFDPLIVSRFTEADVERLMQNEGLIRNHAKISAAIHNASRFLAVQQEFGAFTQYIWGFVCGKTIHNHWQAGEDLPATSPESDALAKDMKKRGFKFVGSTTLYAHMQAAGLINDHRPECYRHKELQGSPELRSDRK
ncbi:MAG: DNA-3-methyladenine glycosylase I [Candidatus Melainabacteria bacterium]